MGVERGRFRRGSAPRLVPGGLAVVVPDGDPVRLVGFDGSGCRRRWLLDDGRVYAEWQLRPVWPEEFNRLEMDREFRRLLCST